MPLHPECADPSRERTFQFCVYYTGKTAQKTYVSLDAIPWLIAYAADELHFQGVVCSNAEDIKECNCAAVAGLHVEWDFDGAKYDAEFVEGAHKGVKRSFGVADICEERWTKMLRASIVPEGDDFPTATVAMKKTAAKELVVRWCASIVDGSEKVFAANLGINAENPAVADGLHSPDSPTGDSPAVADVPPDGSLIA